MKIPNDILFFLKISIEFSLIEIDKIKLWADDLILEHDLLDFFVYEVSIAKEASTILEYLNIELESAESINYLDTGRAIIGLINRKLKNNLYDHNKASEKNYSVLLYLSTETDYFSVRLQMDDSFQLAKDGIIGDLEMEKNKLEKYLAEQDIYLIDFIEKNGLNLIL